MRSMEKLVGTTRAVVIAPMVWLGEGNLNTGCGRARNPSVRERGPAVVYCLDGARSSFGGGRMLGDQERGRNMSDAVGLKRSTTTRETQLVKPPDEAVWEAWGAKDRARDSQGRECCVKALTWGSVAALLVVAGLWSRLAPYEVAIRCVLAAAAAGMMMEAFTRQQYAFAVLFAGLG